MSCSMCISVTFQTASNIVDYLRLAYEANMTELKIVCMEWLRDRWHTVKGEDDVKQLMNDEDGKEIIWDFMDCLSKKYLAESTPP